MFESKLIGMRNFSRAFIDGCTNLKASAFKEHASSLMHQKSMVLYKKSQSVPVTEYAPIVKALSTIDERTEVHKYHSSYIKHMSDQKYKLSDQYCHDLTQMSGQCYILITSTGSAQNHSLLIKSLV